MVWIVRLAVSVGAKKRTLRAERHLGLRTVILNHCRKSQLKSVQVTLTFREDSVSLSVLPGLSLNLKD